MKSLFTSTSLAAAFLGGSVAVAQTTPSQVVGGETFVRLDVGFGIRPVPPSRVTVPAGETLRVAAPDLGSDVNYSWTQNGRTIRDATTNVLTINHVIWSDAGTYQCQFSTPNTLRRNSQTLILGVGPTDRLLNLSTRGNAGADADQSLVTGFAVAANGAGKKLILRAIGPSLSLFGVTNPLRTPVLRVFAADGRPYENGFVYPAVIGGLVVMMPFIPGSYTAQVTSGDGAGGAVLLEIYEVP